MPARFTHTHSVTADGDLIGRWSMLDLFVISLTMSLINRDQILAFTMGPAAFYFGAAVILTILAVEWLDSRLLGMHVVRKRPLRRLKRRLKINAVSHPSGCCRSSR
ncbi:paraquat-inducible protein A [Escherichia coli]